MSENTKEVLGIVAVFVVICAIIGGAAILAISTINTTEWTPVDDRCYVWYYEDNRLFGEDSRSRDVYCKR